MLRKFMCKRVVSLMFIITIFLFKNIYAIAIPLTIEPVKIQIIDSTNSKPIAGAEVFLGSRHWISDNLGTITLKNESLSNKILEIKCTGYAIKSIDFKKIDAIKDHIYIIKLQPLEKSLLEVVVSGRQRATSIVKQSVHIGADEIKQHSNESLAKLLENTSGLSSISNGATVAKPVIQGMHGSRILLLENGSCLESQSWGTDHAPEIDPTGFNNIEVIKGAESVRYGSGALGGVVLLNPAPLYFGNKLLSVDGNISSGYSSNGRGKDLSTTLGLSKGDWAMRLHGYIKSSGDYSTANYLLNNTGQQVKSLSILTGYKINNFTVNIYGSYYFAKSGIFYGSHTGGLEELLDHFSKGRPLKESIVAFSNKIDVPYQGTKHILLQCKMNWKLSSFQRMLLEISWQRNHREEYENRRSKIYNNIPVMNLALSSITADLNWHLNWRDPNWVTIAGMSSLYQRNNNKEGTAATTFIPNYVTLSNGMYIIQKTSIAGIKAEAGLRYDFRKTNAAGYDWRREFYSGSKIYNNLTASVAFYKEISSNLSTKLNFGLAWRAPDVNELYSNGLHHGCSWSLGNKNLKSEKGYKAIIGGNYHNDWLKIESSAFYQHIGNYIYDSPDKRLGNKGIHVHWDGVYPIFAFHQNKCSFYGLDIDLSTKIIKNFNISTKYSLVRGRNLDLNTWLPLMPADRCILGIEWHKIWGNRNQWKFDIDTNHIFVAKQSRYDKEKELVDETPHGYGLTSINSYLFYRSKKDYTIKFIFSVENLLNKEYKEYTDRFRYYAHAPGRNINIRTIITF